MKYSVQSDILEVHFGTSVLGHKNLRKRREMLQGEPALRFTHSFPIGKVRH